jgi:hypothetical protein
MGNNHKEYKMKTKAIKLVGLTLALFGVLTLAEAREGGKGKDSGDREGGKKCQKHEQNKNKDDTGDREGRLERFDKDGDGELSPRERKAAQRAKRQRQGDKE